MSVSLRIQLKGEKARNLMQDGQRPSVIRETDTFGDPPQHLKDLTSDLMDLGIPTPNDIYPVWKSGFIWCYFKTTRNTDLFETLEKAVKNAGECKTLLDRLSISFLELSEHNKVVVDTRPKFNPASSSYRAPYTKFSTPNTSPKVNHRVKDRNSRSQGTSGSVGRRSRSHTPPRGELSSRGWPDPPSHGMKDSVPRLTGSNSIVVRPSSVTQDPRVRSRSDEAMPSRTVVPDQGQASAQTRADENESASAPSLALPSLEQLNSAHQALEALTASGNIHALLKSLVPGGPDRPIKVEDDATMTPPLWDRPTAPSGARNACKPEPEEPKPSTISRPGSMSTATLPPKPITGPAPVQATPSMTASSMQPPPTGAGGSAARHPTPTGPAAARHGAEYHDKGNGKGPRKRALSSASNANAESHAPYGKGKEQEYTSRRGEGYTYPRRDSGYKSRWGDESLSNNTSSKGEDVLRRELWDVRRQQTALKAKEHSIVHDLKDMGAVSIPEPGEVVSNDVLFTEKRVKAMEDEIDSLQKELHNERDLREDVEAQLVHERYRRRKAENALDDALREYRSPVILPAMISALQRLSHLTGDALTAVDNDDIEIMSDGRSWAAGSSERIRERGRDPLRERDHRPGPSGRDLSPPPRRTELYSIPRREVPRDDYPPPRRTRFDQVEERDKSPRRGPISAYPRRR